MKTTLLRAGMLSCALLTTTCLTAPALAQGAPEFRQLDGNGVDLVQGDFVMSFTEGSIGSGPAELALVRRNGNSASSQYDEITFRRTVSGDSATIDVGLPGRQRDRFTGGASAFTFTAAAASGATLEKAGYSYVYRTADGTRINFVDPTGSEEAGLPPTSFCAGTSQTECDMLPESIVSPNARRIALTWELYAMPGPSGGTSYEVRLARVTNSHGYAIGFTYQDDGQTWGTPPSSGWRTRSGAQFFNEAVSSTTAQASVGYAYPDGNFAGVVDVTDMAGNVWRVTGSSIRHPGETSPGFSVASSGGVVSSVTRDGTTTNYSRSVSGTTGTMVVTQADGDPNTADPQTTIVSDLAIGRPTSVTDPLNRQTQFQYDGNGRLTRVTAPEGNSVGYTHDARGNVIETRLREKGDTGDTVDDIVTSADFPDTCANAVTCNRPTSTTDARGNVTDYTYDSTHGGVLTVTAPAAASGTVRPQTRYGYTLSNDEYLLTEISAWAAGTAPSCVGTADEIRTVIDYDGSGNTTRVERRSGNATGAGALSAVTTATYNAMGDVATVDGPLTGSDDTVYFRYDAARRRTGTISPDPDGPANGSLGTLKRRAAKVTYRSDGQASRTETGTVEGLTQTDWNAFAPLERVDVTFNADSRPVAQRLVDPATGTVHALAETSYDALGRPLCSALRMDPGRFGATTDACTQSSQLAGVPDRIGRTVYDAAGQVTQQRSAVGTALEAAEVAFTYRDNGQVETLTDAEDNRTSNEYDDHDRLLRTRFPVPTQGANQSSAGDYEEYGYDNAGNLVSHGLRDGTTISFAYDALNRLVEKDLPGTEPTVIYGYDLLGRMTSAASSHQSLSFTWDALGRNLTQTGPLGTLRYEYDAAGRRTSMTWPDNFWVTYEYLVTGETSIIREQGGTLALARFAYDDLGRRTGLTRGNGTTTSYGYDAASRLETLTHDLAGTTGDLTLTFTHNPAAQIVSNTRSNDAYSFTGLANVNVADVHNGLNQVTQTGSTAVSHDARGNTIAIGTSGYHYTSENRLNHGPDWALLTYDPLGRLYFTSSATTPDSWILSDGANIAAELDGSIAITRRYVHGPGVDEPLVWYEGSGTADRRYLHADERGSIIAVSDSSGAVTAINRYDEYGVPQGTLTGLFGYTGQAWLRELAMYYYRARIYNPALGRFMQPDPIGYGGGMNLYAYVGGDPVNFTDPLGLSECLSGTAGDYEYYDENDNGQHDPGEGVVPNSVSAFEYQICAGWEPFSFGGGGGGGGAGDTDDPCNAPLPDGSTINRNVDYIRNLLRRSESARQVGDPRGLAHLYVTGAWVALVQPGGRWDYKRHRGTEAQGNMNFGATGSLLFPLDVLLRGAGAVQEDPRGILPGRPWDSPPSTYGDDPRDIQQIREGARICRGTGRQ